MNRWNFPTSHVRSRVPHARGDEAQACRGVRGIALRRIVNAQKSRERSHSTRSLTMPIEFSYQPRTFSDPSELTEGLHPCYLLEVVEEPVPEGWEMQKRDPLMWRWFFAVWESP